MPAFKWSELKADFITPSYSSGRGPVITGERIDVGAQRPAQPVR